MASGPRHLNSACPRQQQGARGPREQGSGPPHPPGEAQDLRAEYTEETGQPGGGTLPGSYGDSIRCLPGQPHRHR